MTLHLSFLAFWVSSSFIVPMVVPVSFTSHVSCVLVFSFRLHIFVPHIHNTTVSLLLCLRMTRHHRPVLLDRVTPCQVHQNCQMSKDRSLINAQVLSRTSDLGKPLNPECPCYSNSLSLMMTPTKISSGQPTTLTSTCSTISSVTGEAMLGELMTSTNKLLTLEPANRSAPKTNQQSKLTLLEHLSDHIQSRQTMRTMSMRKGLILTTAHYRGLSPKIQNTIRKQHYPCLFRKPMLCSRISLKMSNEHVCPSLIVIDQFHSFSRPNGSIFSAETLSTSITSFPMSTQCPTTPRTLLNSERTLSYSTAPLCPQKQSRPMVTGS